jgi:hypothetical protein
VLTGAVSDLSAVPIDLVLVFKSQGVVLESLAAGFFWLAWSKLRGGQLDWNSSNLARDSILALSRA